MLLPALLIPISIKVFETNLEYFINEYMNFEYTPNLIYKKNDIVSRGHRYSLFYEQKDSKNPSPTRIGEIDVIIVHSERVEVKAAVYEIKHPCNGRDFFDKFYYMIFKKWEISPDFDDPSSIATNKSIRIGFETGYFDLPGSLPTMPEKGEKPLSKEEWKSNFSSTIDSYLSGSDPKPKETIRKYRLELDKRLPETYQAEISGGKQNHNVHERTRMRAERIKEIKDNHLHWSQFKVVDKYNNKYKGDDQISLSILRNVYSSMGWKWQRADRM